MPFVMQAQRGIVHLTLSPEIIEYVFSPGINHSDSLLHDRARPTNPNLTIA